MKKVFKFISIIAIVGVVIIGGYVGFIEISDKISDIKHDNERINDSDTLTKYILHHSHGYVHSSSEELEFVSQNLKCSAIKDDNIFYYNRDVLILNDFSIYEVITGKDKLYSNNEQCKKIDTDIKIDDIKLINNNIFYYSDDKLYTYESYEKKFNDYSSYKNYDDYKLYLLGYTNIMQDSDLFYAIKDGNIVSFNYKDNNIINEKILYSKEEYGYIRSFEYSGMLISDWGSYHELEKAIVSSMITDKSFYVIRKIETEECLKYEDIDCEYKLVKSDIYEKYKKDIKYMNINYTILNDNSIISNDVFKLEIDKEVK